MRAVLLGLALVLALGGAASVPAEELRTILTRPGVTQSFLLLQPSGPPVASVILFAGGHGRLDLSPRGIGWGRNNFLVRTRQQFVQQDLLVALVDSPSDRGEAGLVRFRTSAGHAEDIRAVIAALRKMAEAPVWLVGTSMGTVSAASVAARLSEGGPDGLVLTSSVTRTSRQMVESLDDVPIKRVRVPTLVVHHKQDSCQVTPYGDAVLLVNQLTVPRKELLTFEGGDPPRSQPCEAMAAHGYLGLEARVVEAIAAWIKATPKP